MRRRLTLALFAGLLSVGMIAGPAAATEPTKTIAEIAVGSPDFTTLVAALKCTDLVGAVAAKDANLTVFAPTNAAFRKFGLTERNICWLPKGLLSKILLYHVASPALDSGKVLGSKRIQMLSGLYTFPSLRGGTPYINRYAKISTPDVNASNGVIHVIDSVLIPYSFR